MQGKVESRIELIGKYSAALSVIEIALGSILHSFHMPFSGNFLSLNQGYLLCRASLEAREMGLGAVGYNISNVAAVLKSLAPAGKKLGPMLSLSMQGLLFGAGEFLLGANIAGMALGMALLSLWTFLQPVITYYIFFGSELPKAVAYLFEKTVPYHGLSWGNLAWILLAVVGAKALAAVGLAYWATRGKGNELQDRLLCLAEEQGVRPLEGSAPTKLAAFRLAFMDLLRPLFLLSLAITALFLFFSEQRAGEWIWVLLRPIAIGFLFFYFSRTLTLDRWLERLHGTRAEAFARSCQKALESLRHFGSQKISSAQ